MAKERELILKAEPCDLNLHKGGPNTLAEARDKWPDPCPRLAQCQAKPQHCVMRHGLEVARFAIKGGHSVDEEMRDFRKEAPGVLRDVTRGMIWSPDRQTFQMITDLEEGIRLIGQFAKNLLGESLIDSSQTKPRRSFEGLVASCADERGAIDLAKLDAAEGSCGHNGGRGCDVTEGPCSCGAWH